MKRLYKITDTFENVSYDDSNKESMTHSQTKCIHFDKVKRGYSCIKHLSDMSSVDALYIKNENNRYFIEFKNGFIDKSVSYEIRQKIYDSFLMALEIENKTLDSMRQNTEFILVYNGKKNEANQVWEGSSEEISVAPSRTRIANMLARKAKVSFVRFNLAKFEGYCFRKVWTLNEREFEELLGLK